MNKNALANLESNEAILLMYLADELPPTDRAEVEHMLDRDGGLRAQLALLRDMEQDVHSRLDAAPGDIDVSRAIRSTQAAMRRAQHSPQLSTIPKPEPTKLLLPWWAYPITAAASILLAAAIFLANTAPPPVAGAFEFTPVNIEDILSSDVMTDSSMPREEALALADEIAASFDDSDHVIVTSTHGLFAAARELDAIRESSIAFDRLAVQ